MAGNACVFQKLATAALVLPIAAVVLTLVDVAMDELRLLLPPGVVGAADMPVFEVRSCDGVCWFVPVDAVTGAVVPRQIGCARWSMASSAEADRAKIS